jgi:hypothetical protein
MKADQGPFFSEMRGVRRNLGEMAGPADSLFPGQPVDAAISRTERATFQDLERSFNFFREEPFSESTKIGRFKIRDAHRCCSGMIKFPVNIITAKGRLAKKTASASIMTWKKRSNAPPNSHLRQGMFPRKCVRLA